jgi:hypothetical protein
MRARPAITRRAYFFLGMVFLPGVAPLPGWVNISGPLGRDEARVPFFAPLTLPIAKLKMVVRLAVIIRTKTFNG